MQMSPTSYIYGIWDSDCEPHVCDVDDATVVDITVDITNDAMLPSVSPTFRKSTMSAPVAGLSAGETDSGARTKIAVVSQPLETAKMSMANIGSASLEAAERGKSCAPSAMKMGANTTRASTSSITLDCNFGMLHTVARPIVSPRLNSKNMWGTKIACHRQVPEAEAWMFDVIAGYKVRVTANTRVTAAPQPRMRHARSRRGLPRLSNALAALLWMTLSGAFTSVRFTMRAAASDSASRFARRTHALVNGCCSSNRKATITNMTTTQLTVK